VSDRLEAVLGLDSAGIAADGEHHRAPIEVGLGVETDAPVASHGLDLLDLDAEVDRRIWMVAKRHEYLRVGGVKSGTGDKIAPAGVVDQFGRRNPLGKTSITSLSTVGP
jgi:hypothetical protein